MNPSTCGIQGAAEAETIAMAKPETGVRVHDYYDTNPSLDHIAGDIWVDLPTFGVLRPTRVAGIIITPACDLAHRKAEAITYLPIVPIREYFIGPAFAPEIVRETNGHITAANTGCITPLGSASRNAPSPDSIQNMIASLSSWHKGTDIGHKEAAAGDRALAGLPLLHDVSSGTSRLADSMNDVGVLLGAKAFGKLAERLVTNAYRTDIHFLPVDGQREDWSGVFEHSLALFRYPLSVPLELLDLAQEASEEDWPKRMDRIATITSCAASFSSKRPMKRLSCC